MLVYLAGAIDMIQDRKDGDITKTWKARAKEELNNNEIYPCTFTLTKDGKIYIAPSDVCFGFTTHSKCVAGTYPLVLSFMADDSEPEINIPEAKKAAT